MHGILAGLLSSCLGNGASPRGPKFGISILCGNGPPFAACHHKIGGFGLARVPPAERGPVFPLCSMTPLIPSVSSPSHFITLAVFTSSRKTSTSHPKWTVLFLLNRHVFSKWRKVERCRAAGEPRSSPS